MDLIELGSALGDFFAPALGLVGPSHDQITQAVTRFSLGQGDPRRDSETVGKMKRVRDVLIHATDNDPEAGLNFAQQVVSLLRASSRFVETSDSFAGKERVDSLRAAFDRIGFELDASGALRPLVIDNLSGTKMTDGLNGYVRRVNLSPDDAPLQVGTGKELDEATARHVLNEKLGGYSTSDNFPVTLSNAFTALGLKLPPGTTIQSLDKDPQKQMEECLFLLACAVNRLRNAQGTGHGRPATSTISPTDARLAARATALIAGTLLDRI